MTFLAATKLLYEWFSLSFDNVLVIVLSWNVQEWLLLTMQKVKVKGQRSGSQRSKPNSLAVSGPKLQFEFTYGDELMHKAWCGIGE